MPHVITDACIGNCHATCVDACPTGSIHPTKEEWDEGYNDLSNKQLYINPETCLDCTICEEACPEYAIYEYADLPENQMHQIEINKNYYKNT